MMAVPGIHRRTALQLMVQFYSELPFPRMDQTGNQEEKRLCDFWELLRTCLVSQILEEDYDTNRKAFLSL
jgi:hypothetical protein